jgi:polyphosphate kinase
VIGTLDRAARNGKDVTAVIELRARFDEAANIDFAQRLQEVGAKVVYGIVGYKTHAKMLLIVRRETMGLRRYVHMSTGNYHARTSREYTDMGLFTCDEAIGQDVQKLFMQLTGTGEKVRLKKLLSSPFRLHKSLIRLIDDEAAAAQAGQPAHIRIRVNAINDQAVIEALYRASQAGVQIDMIVRTICCLKPGLPDVSQNIRVRSVVGRFLEHTRAFCFHAGGKELIYLSSADLLGRNLHGRVEIAFPVEEPRHKRRVIKELFEIHFSEANDSWNLRSDGNWRRHVSPPDPTKSSQNWLLKKLGNV